MVLGNHNWYSNSKIIGSGRDCSQLDGMWKKWVERVKKIQTNRYKIIPGVVMYSMVTIILYCMFKVAKIVDLKSSLHEKNL